jgi:hypothetical protein
MGFPTPQVAVSSLNSRRPTVAVRASTSNVPLHVGSIRRIAEPLAGFEQEVFDSLALFLLGVPV